MKEKTILIIEGGGADGLLAIGALKYYIEDNQEKYDAIFGTSIGGVIGFALGYYVTKFHDWISAINELEKLFEGLKWTELISRPLFTFFRRGGFLKSKIAKTFNEKIGSIKISSLTLPVRAITTDIDAEDPVKLLSGNYKINEAAAMTANIPGVFGYYQDPFDGHRCFDGGVSKNNSIAEAVNFAEAKGWKNVSYVVIRMGHYSPKKKGFLLTVSQNLFNLFYISRNQNEKLSLKISKLYQRIAKLEGNDLDIRILEIRQEVGLLKFNPKHNSKFIEAGYQLAKKEGEK